MKGIVAEPSRPRDPASRRLPPVAPVGSLAVRERGHDLIDEPLLNKGTAFPADERTALALGGLLPARVSTIDEQVRLELEHVRRKTDELERYIGLAALQDRNETLFYRVLGENLEEFLPIVYTPTVGRACQEFSHIFRRPRGVWITPDDVDRIDEILHAGARGDVRLIVVTDNERILGLGDLGAGGMAIPVGKLTLYTAAAGIHPSWTLPVSLDIGTDREELLRDPLYLGYRAPRLRGAAYAAVVDAFVAAVRRTFPGALLQWEDFKQHNALEILDHYRTALPSFNDDIQGTGAVVLGGLLAARRPLGLSSDRVLILGAGAAGLGIAALLRRQFVAEGVRAGRAVRTGGPAIALMDHRGLVHRGRADTAPDQRSFAVEPEWFFERGLVEAELANPVAIARAMQATILIGTTGVRGAFSRELVEAIGLHARMPIILPLSNPTDRAEATAEDVLAWTEDRAIVATGSPSAAVGSGPSRRLVGQANNVFVFPGVGLGAIVAGAREIPEDAFLAAASTLASLVSAERLAARAIYPPIDELRSVSRAIAITVVGVLRDLGLGRELPDGVIPGAVDAAMWRPDYVPFVPDEVSPC
jgi:malic enzyme